LLICYFGFVVIGMPGGVLNVAWVHVEGSFNLSLDSLGVLLFVGTVGSLLITFSSGPIISRLDIGLFLLIASLVMGSGMLGVALVPSWGLLILANMIAGAGFAAIDIGVNTFGCGYFEL
jgi:MFS family permease